MVNFQEKSLISLGWKNKLLRFIHETGTDNPVLFIYMQKHLNEFSSIFTDLIKEGVKPRLICMNSDMPLYFEKLKDHYKDIKLGEDYLEVEDYENIDDFVYKLTTNWHLFDNVEFKDIINYCDINLGLVVEFDFQLFLVRRIKMLEMIDSVIKKEKPAGFAIISDSPEEFLGITELIKNSYGIRLITLFKKVNKQTQTFSLKRNLKGMAADYVTNLIDALVRVRILTNYKLKNKILIDKRISDDLSKSASLPKNFFPTPFEKGLRLRIELLKKEGHYFPFYFPSGFSYARDNKYLRKFKVLEMRLFAQGIFQYKNFFIGSIAKPKLEEYFKLTFPRLVKNINLFEQFFKKHPLNGLILRHDLWDLQRLAVELGKKYRIPSIVVQHGVFGEKLERIIFADKIAVWGKMCTEIYKSFGNQESKCVVTGNPKHDIFHNNTRPKFSRREICEQLKLDPNKDIIVFLSGPVPHIHSAYVNRDRGEVVIKYLVRIMSEFSDKQLVIKLHPYEDGIFAEEAIKYFNVKNTVAIKAIDLYSLLNASDLVISRESSAALKAMILEKPLITLNFDKRKDIVPYAPEGAALGIYKPGDIFPAIRRVFSDSSLRINLREKSKDFIHNYAYAIDGKSSERVLKLIQETAKCKN